MILDAFLSRRACVFASAACLALALGGCFDSGGSDDTDDVSVTAPAEVPIVTAPTPPVTEPGDACTCTAPDTQRSCAP